jgi:hypothetical protein
MIAKGTRWVESTKTRAVFSLADEWRPSARINRVHTRRLLLDAHLLDLDDSSAVIRARKHKAGKMAPICGQSPMYEFELN